MELLLGVLLVGGLLLLPMRADDTHCCSSCGTKDARHERQIKRLARRHLKPCSRADHQVGHALRRKIELVRAFHKLHRARVRAAREDTHATPQPPSGRTGTCLYARNPPIAPEAAHTPFLSVRAWHSRRRNTHAP